MMMNCSRVAAERAVKAARDQGREPLEWYLKVLAAYAARDREEVAACKAAVANREADRLRRMRREKARRSANGGAFGKLRPSWR